MPVCCSSRHLPKRSHSAIKHAHRAGRHGLRQCNSARELREVAVHFRHRFEFAKLKFPTAPSAAQLFANAHVRVLGTAKLVGMAGHLARRLQQTQIYALARRCVDFSLIRSQIEYRTLANERFRDRWPGKHLVGDVLQCRRYHMQTGLVAGGH